MSLMEIDCLQTEKRKLSKHFRFHIIFIFSQLLDNETRDKKVLVGIFKFKFYIIFIKPLIIRELNKGRILLMHGIHST